LNSSPWVLVEKRAVLIGPGYFEIFGICEIGGFPGKRGWQGV
jgi:hypothetical protein